METALTNNTFENPEDDPFDPYEYEIGTAETILKFITDYLIFIVRLLLCIVNLACCVLFIYAVYKFKGHQTRINFILLNYFVCISCYSVSLTIMSAAESYPLHVYHALNLVIFVSLDASILFALLLGIDWFLWANCERVFAKYKVSYQGIIATIYSLLFSLSICFLIVPRLKLNHSIVLISVIMYFICVLCLAIFNIIKRRKTYSQDVLKSSYILTISNVFFVLFLPTFLIIILSMVYSGIHELSSSIQVIIVCIFYIVMLVGFSSPIIILILLIKLDKNFRLSYHNILKSSVRRWTDLENDNAENYLDIDEP